MFPRQIYAILFAFLLQPSALLAEDHGSGSQSQSKSFLSDNLVRKDQVQNVLEHKPATKEAACKQIPEGPIETTLCDYETVESYNDDLYNVLHQLVETPFFKYFRVDLYRECPFWQENGLCMNRECGITTVDESEIPEKWRAAELSKVELPSEDERHHMLGCYYRDADFCFQDDMSEGDYIDLTANPERFTGYVGPSAQRVWAAIYRENCFGLSELNFQTPNSPNNSPHVSLPDSMASAQSPEDRTCLEQRVYYRIISGLHASISTHVCHDYFNQSTGQWGPNLECFVEKVAAYPERLQYIYFNVVLLLRAVSRIGPYLSAYDYCGTGTHEGDALTLDRVNKVVDIASQVGKFDETVLFKGDNANILKEEFKEHFRNVTRIMDCVGCDKCRLWGKIQTTGVGTALKILFELDEKALDPRHNSNLLTRSEVVALINTLHRFSESLAGVNDFRKMWAETDAAEEARLIGQAKKVVESAAKPRHSPFAGSDIPPHQGFISELQRWMKACKEGTVECVRGVIEGVLTLLQIFTSIFKLSGKDQPPRTDL
ncbi:EROs family protein [Abortiporus biennis]